MLELLLSEYGIWDRSLGKPIESMDYLIDSWIRRKQWEFEQQALHTINALAKAMNPKEESSGQMPLNKLAMMGISVPEGI